MFPVSDVIPSRTTPYVTVGLIAANALAFLYELQLSTPELRVFAQEFGVVPAHFAWPTVLTSMFLHGSWIHVLGNMLYLWIFGNNVEDAMGKIRFVVFYLLCGVGAACIQILVNPASRVPMVGASGAISGVLGAYLVLFPHARILTLLPLGILLPIVEIRAVFVIGFWVVVQVLNGLLTFDFDGGGVAWFAHIGGFAAGCILVLFFRRRSYSR